MTNTESYLLIAETDRDGDNWYRVHNMANGWSDAIAYSSHNMGHERVAYLAGLPVADARLLGS